MRGTVGVAAWVALITAAWLVVRSERQITAREAALRHFDQQARQTRDGLFEMRADQQAYVAAGQGVIFWTPRVAQALDDATKTIATLRQSASSLGGRASLEAAAGALAEFVNVDTRARDFLASGQQFMAGDVIFAEGRRVVTMAIEDIEMAQSAERQASDAQSASLRGRQALALTGSGLIAAVTILLLGLTGPLEPGSEHGQPADATADASKALLARTPSPVLNTAARLCTDFGRVRDLNDLTPLLARCAGAIDARGLVVWLGGRAGADLQPVFAHGYSPQAVARMGSVPRTADNAAAAAYRTSQLQIVRSRPGSEGAIVAPILSSEGCVGALSAEIRSGGEGSESVQALASIIAAQLANILASPQDARKNRTA